MGYETPDSISADVICRRLVLSVTLWDELTDYLERFGYTWQWEQTTGGLTPEQVSEYIEGRLDAFHTSECHMIGSIIPYVTATLPEGVLPCNGTNYNRIDYPDLYALLDAAFIIDADTFQTPDLRGRTIVGTGSGVGLTTRDVGDTFGTESHQLSNAEMPSHRHEYQMAIFADLDLEAAGVPQPAIGATIASLTDIRGADQPHENMQPSIAINYGLIASL